MTQKLCSELPRLSTARLGVPPTHTLGVEKQAVTRIQLSEAVWEGLPVLLLPRPAIRGCLIWARGYTVIGCGYGGRRGFPMLLFRALCLSKLG